MHTVKCGHCLHREDSIREGTRSIQEVITVWDRHLGDTAYWAVRERDVGAETYGRGWTSLRAFAPATPAVGSASASEQKNRGVEVWAQLLLPHCDLGQATFLPWASVSSSVHWDCTRHISKFSF